MDRKNLVGLVGFILCISFILAGCLPTQSTATIEPVNQATRQAAATGQAEVNLLQNEAFTLEQTLNAEFSEHYVGMMVESYPVVKVIIYLTGGTKADLAQFVSDPKLMEVIEVREEAISRKALRETREALKLDMDNAGVTYTTALMMEPARLEVYVLDILGTRAMLSSRDVPIPEHVKFIQKESLPAGG
jgi:hypothetical protein